MLLYVKTCKFKVNIKFKWNSIPALKIKHHSRENPRSRKKVLGKKVERFRKLDLMMILIILGLFLSCNSIDKDIKLEKCCINRVFFKPPRTCQIETTNVGTQNNLWIKDKKSIMITLNCKQTNIFPFSIYFKKTCNMMLTCKSRKPRTKHGCFNANCDRSSLIWFAIL